MLYTSGGFLSFNTAHSPSSIKTGSKLRGGGLHILNWDRARLGCCIEKDSKILQINYFSAKLSCSYNLIVIKVTFIQKRKLINLEDFIILYAVKRFQPQFFTF